VDSQALDSLSENLLAQLGNIDNLVSLEKFRVSTFGKKGLLTEQFKKLSQLSSEDRIAFAKSLNLSKEKVQLELVNKTKVLKQQQMELQLKESEIDISRPGVKKYVAGIHPVTQVQRQLASWFIQQGFELKFGPEIENEHYNFTALNVPKDHPARDMQDTFYIKGGLLLRTHSSSVQIRTLEQQDPPVRMISFGRVYRRDSDPTHVPMFHQLEGLVVNKSVQLDELKQILVDLLKFFFGRDVPYRFRTSYFPFTSPSFEVDIKLPNCNSTDCWMEVLGCGMVHPNVLKGQNLDPEIFQGYAFGLGLDRFAMLKYQIADLRQCFSNPIQAMKTYVF
jgi:phenylalanyl-tRNA synthetase alpha chain